MARRPRRMSLFGQSPPSSLPPGMLMSQINLLRRTEQPERAERLLRDTVIRDPAQTVELLALLRAANQRSDAHFLLRAIADAPEQACARMVTLLCAKGASGDLDNVFTLLSARPAVAVATIAAGVLQLQPGTAVVDPAEPLIAGLSQRPIAELVTACGQARADSRAAEAGILTTALARRPPHEIRIAAAALAAGALPEDAWALLTRFARAASCRDFADLFTTLARSWQQAAAWIAPFVAERADSAALLSALSDGVAGRGNQRPDVLIGFLSAQDIVSLCRKLTAQGAYETVDTVLVCCLRRSSFTEVRSLLYQDNQYAIAYRLAELRAELTGRYET